MKKLTLMLCALTFIISSCSSDDDSSSGQDPIIGTWNLHQRFTNDVEEVLTSCQKQETFTFSSDGSAQYEYYEINNENCVLEESFTATWSNEGNNNYDLTAFGETSTQNINFEGNTFYYEFTDSDDDIDPVFNTIREVYIKN